MRIIVLAIALLVVAQGRAAMYSRGQDFSQNYDNQITPRVGIGEYTGEAAILNCACAKRILSGTEMYDQQCANMKRATVDAFMNVGSVTQVQAPSQGPIQPNLQHMQR